MSRTLQSFILFIIAGCSAALPFLTEQDAKQAADRWPDTTLKTLNMGRSAYVNKCSGCHSLHAPGEFSEAQWMSAMDRMQPKARLSDNEKVLILRYLLIAGTSPHHEAFKK